MAGMIHQQLASVRFFEEKGCWCQHKHTKPPHRFLSTGPLYMDFKLPWIDGLHNPSRAGAARDGLYNPSRAAAAPIRALALSTEAQPGDGLYNPSRVAAVPIRGVALSTQAQPGELSDKVVHDRTLSPHHDERTAFVALVRACAKNKDLHTGTQLHNDILKRGLVEKCSDALVNMYANCGALVKAKELLDRHKSRNVFSWTALIAGYARQGQSQDALNCFERMQREGLSPNAVTFACVLKACGRLKAAEKGKQIHEEIARQGLLGNDVVLGTALVDMYAKCGALMKAQRVLEGLPFRNVVSWSALIAGYAQQGQGEQALNCFEHMQREGLSPDAVTFVSILKACGSIKAVEKGKQIHDEISRQGLLGKHVVLGTALVDMYAKCGVLVEAQRVLEELPSRDAVAWSALIAGYAQHGQGEEALNCFKRMKHEGFSPDAVTFACVLKACGTVGAADMGEQVHDEIVHQGLLRKDIVLGNTLVDMYAKCGALAKAQQVLDELPSRDVVSWNALITGYTQQGQSDQALNCFERMQHEGFPPNAVTFSCVLNACCHLGLVEDGHVYFENMGIKYGVKPDIEHYTCMVDLLGRAGHLQKAIRVIQEMPSSDHSAVWHALLGACGKWGDVNVGRWAFEQAVQVNKNDWTAYVLLANLYAAAGMQEDAENIEALRVEREHGRSQSVIHRLT